VLVLVLVLEDHPDCPLAQLGRITPARSNS
jgi:hypothetical protein